VLPRAFLGVWLTDGSCKAEASGQAIQSHSGMLALVSGYNFRSTIKGLSTRALPGTVEGHQSAASPRGCSMGSHPFTSPLETSIPIGRSRYWRRLGGHPEMLQLFGMSSFGHQLNYL